MTFDPSKSQLPGPNIILMGEGGTGKTHSVGTLVEAGIETFYFGLEPGLESLLGYWTDVRPDNPKPRPIPPNLHWHKLAAPKFGYDAFAQQATRVNTLALKTLAEAPDTNRFLHNLWIKVAEAMFNFPDDRTGKTFGPVDEWGPERAIVIDGMTGLCRAAMSCVVGSRPVWAPGDYQVGQKQVEGFLRMTCDNTRCWFVLISHVEKEIDPINGGMSLTVSAIGKALAPVVPPMFSDVVLCTREGNKWAWNTARAGVATKARNLPWADGLAPDFRAMYKTWATRAEAMETPLTEG
jgi:hypothetical protein